MPAGCQGSFVGTDSVGDRLGNQGFLVLQIQKFFIPADGQSGRLLFNQIRAASIQNNSVTGLGVPNGRSLLLVGGDINMDGGRLFAFGGRVELGGLAGVGTVGLNGDGNNLLSLSFPDSVERSDVSLSNGGRVTVIAGDGGSIAINARNLEMTGGSFLFAGIESGLGSSNSKAGNIDINATGVINLNNSSLISNQVRAEANGQAGNISISANTLQISSGAQVGVITSGKGKGGNLTVDAENVQLIGTGVDSRFPSGLSTSAQPNSTGDAGDLTIKTNTLLVRDGAQVSASTFGAGKGGNLTIDAQNIQLIGRSADNRFGSRLAASAERNSTKDAGNLTIKTNTLLVRDGAQVSAGTFGAGKGGNLTIDAQDVQIIGRSVDLGVPSGLFADADQNSTGDAGNLTIKTNTLLVRDGAQVGAGTSGKGKGGNLTIDAQDVQLIGTTPDGLFPSALSATAQRNSTGDAGDLTIKTNTLLVRDGAQVSASTWGAGKGGNLRVDAQDVQLIGKSADGQIGSGLFASTEDPNSIGDAGDLTIKTNTLLVRDGAAVSTATFGAGKGGNLSVDAQDVQLIGSGLFASTQQNSIGDAGDLTIKTNTLLVRDGAQVTASTRGAGKGGNLSVDAQDVQLIGTGR
jgi:large exoprotein involved in heme utilization and adhesion